MIIGLWWMVRFTPLKLGSKVSISFFLSKTKDNGLMCLIHCCSVVCHHTNADYTSISSANCPTFFLIQRRPYASSQGISLPSGSALAQATLTSWCLEAVAHCKGPWLLALPWWSFFSPRYAPVSSLGSLFLVPFLSFHPSFLHPPSPFPFPTSLVYPVCREALDRILVSTMDGERFQFGCNSFRKSSNGHRFAWPK
jgi:hypothetical protein